MEDEAPEFGQESVNDIYQNCGPGDGNKIIPSEATYSTNIPFN